MQKNKVQDVSKTITPKRKRVFGAIAIIGLGLVIMIASILGITLRCKFILKKNANTLAQISDGIRHP